MAGTAGIPSLDLHAFTQGNVSQRENFATALGGAFEQYGFVAIKNHGLDTELTRNLYDAVQRFFSLPDHVKQAYENEQLNGQRGYVSKGKEKAKGRNTGDLKEFYHVGQPLENADVEMPANIWPKEVPEFKTHTLAAFNALLRTGLDLLQAIALHLKLPFDYFDEYVATGNSILRPIHYFPIDELEALPPDAVRAAAHGDINLITLLMGASADGLQILSKDGEWTPITAPPDQIVVNVGDMLERHTNGQLKSTIHRVVNPPLDQMTTSRYSIPFFVHPVSSMDLSCLGVCVDAQHPKRFEDITAGEFLIHRLNEIGLIK